MTRQDPHTFDDLAEPDSGEPDADAADADQVAGRRRGLAELAAQVAEGDFSERAFARG